MCVSTTVYNLVWDLVCLANGLGEQAFCPSMQQTFTWGGIRFQDRFLPG